jgi:D-serine deaminase-like pyridoxal phosphate-dependent protein
VALENAVLDRKPAQAGAAVKDVPTPALLVDLDALRRNILRLSKYLGEGDKAVALRPHAKTHKSVAIAALQIEAGAVGVCCQTVREVEAMAVGGVKDVLLANEIATADKAERLALTAKQATISVCVDDRTQVTLLSAAARRHGVELGVLVEIDVGGRRCGVTPSEAPALARYIAASSGLRLEGLQAYHGPAQHLRLPEERAQAIHAAAAASSEAAAGLVAAGLGRPKITGAGTGTFEHEAASGVYGELQCGSYVFMDADYGRNRRAPDSRTPEFEQSLFVLSTVLSTRGRERVVSDAGLKAISFDSGPPLVAGHRDIVYLGQSDEHSSFAPGPSDAFAVGDKIRFIPGHCDPTANLHDFYVVHQGETVVDIWPIARGF